MKKRIIMKKRKRNNILHITKETRCIASFTTRQNRRFQIIQLCSATLDSGTFCLPVKTKSTVRSFITNSATFFHGLATANNSLRSRTTTKRQTILLICFGLSHATSPRKSVGLELPWRDASQKDKEPWQKGLGVTEPHAWKEQWRTQMSAQIYPYCMHDGASPHL